MTCRGCCHLNHVEHESGGCCAHDLERFRVTIPAGQKRQIESRAELEGVSTGAWCRRALETFGELVEAEPEGPDEAERLELTIPAYLAKIARERDRGWVARRLEAELRRKRGGA